MGVARAAVVAIVVAGVLLVLVVRIKCAHFNGRVGFSGGVIYCASKGGHNPRLQHKETDNEKLAHVLHYVAAARKRQPTMTAHLCPLMGRHGKNHGILWVESP